MYFRYTEIGLVIGAKTLCQREIISIGMRECNDFFMMSYIRKVG